MFFSVSTLLLCYLTYACIKWDTCYLHIIKHVAFIGRKNIAPNVVVSRNKLPYNIVLKAWFFNCTTRLSNINDCYSYERLAIKSWNIRDKLSDNIQIYEWVETLIIKGKIESYFSSFQFFTPCSNGCEYHHKVHSFCKYDAKSLTCN